MPCEDGVVCQLLGERQFGGQLDGIEAAVKFVDVELAGVDIAVYQERLDLGDRCLNPAVAVLKRARLEERPEALLDEILAGPLVEAVVVDHWNAARLLQTGRASGGESVSRDV